MSRMTFTGSRRDPKPDPLAELDIDELVDRLTPGEIQRLLDECDPDDPHMPPSMRSNYKCAKEPTGPLNRKALQDFINDQVIFAISYDMNDMIIVNDDLTNYLY